MIHQSMDAWVRGALLAREGLYDLLRKKWPSPEHFNQSFLVIEKVSPLSQWVSRALRRKGWVIRKTTVSQKVPEDWPVIAQTEAKRICETFRAAGIDVLINADEMFLKVYPDNEHVIAPEGAKRMGSMMEKN